MAGEQHPDAMGSSTLILSLGADSPQRSVDALQDEVMATGKTVIVPEGLFFRYHKLCCLQKEETYVSFDVRPIYDDSSEVKGTLVSYRVSTRQVLGLRRSSFFRSLVDGSHDISTMMRLQLKLQSAFDTCGQDWPIIMFYLRADLFADSAHSPAQPGDTKTSYKLFAHAGVNLLDKRKYTLLLDENEGDLEARTLLGSYARKAQLQKQSIMFDHHRLEGYCARRAHNETSRHAKIVPFFEEDAQESVPYGYLFMTFSPVRPIDDDYVDYSEAVESVLKEIFISVQRASVSRARLAEAEHARQFGAKFYSIVDDSPIGINLQVWSTQNVVYGNRSFREILGLPLTGDAVLNSWAEYIHPEDLPDTFGILTNFKVGDVLKGHRMRLSRLYTNGKPRWIDVNCTFHHSFGAADEIVTYLATAITDVSEAYYIHERSVEIALDKERLAADQRAHEERAREAEKAKARQLLVVDMLSHELNNPISAIVQTVEVILENFRQSRCTQAQSTTTESAIQQSMEDLGTIEICTTHMSRVINDALNASKLEHGSLSITIAPCDLVAHIRSILRMLQQEMKNNNISFSGLQIDASWTQNVRCVLTDALRYKQVLLNLLTNAIKFTSLHDGRRRIEVHLYADLSSDEPGKAHLRCAVTDSGSGIREQDVGKLFGGFQVESELKTHVNYGGSGLGLFISQRLAHLLSGHIAVETEVGVGSTFIFTILAQVSDTHCPGNIEKFAKENVGDADLRLAMTELSCGGSQVFQKVDYASQASSSPDSIHPRTPPPLDIRANDEHNDLRKTQLQAEAKQATVLVVEDNLINQKLLVKQMRMAGYNVLVGNHGQEALNHFKAGHKIDLVLTDIEMPILNGLEFLAAVRDLEQQMSPNVELAHSDFLGPPFIACSAYARPEQRQQFLKAGMADVITKPYKFDDLRKTVQQNIDAHRVKLGHSDFAGRQFSFKRHTTM